MTELAEPPMFDHLTDHDCAHFKTYLRVLDGVSDDAESADTACVVLGVDIDRNSQRGFRLFKAYHTRAVWMTKHGYRELARLNHDPGDCRLIQAA